MTRTRVTVDAKERLLAALKDEADQHDRLAVEMARIAAEGCGNDFAASLCAVARNHRIRAIALRAEIAALWKTNSAGQAPAILPIPPRRQPE